MRSWRGVLNSKRSETDVHRAGLAPPALRNDVVTIMTFWGRTIVPRERLDEPHPTWKAKPMQRLNYIIGESAVAKFAHMAHAARFPAFAWKTIVTDMWDLPSGTRPTRGQMIEDRHHETTLWNHMVLRFDQMTTVQWAEHLDNEEERLHNALRYLGTTPNKVATRLDLAGVMGEQFESCNCPISNYLTGVCGAWFASVRQDASMVDFVEVSNPSAVYQFIAEFDANRHDELNLLAFDPASV